MEYELSSKANSKNPVEKHQTAAWANIETTKEISHVAEPNEWQISNAKEYVDENEK